MKPLTELSQFHDAVIHDFANYIMTTYWKATPKGIVSIDELNNGKTVIYRSSLNNFAYDPERHSDSVEMCSTYEDTVRHSVVTKTLDKALTAANSMY